jgi:hypothetical protein
MNAIIFYFLLTTPIRISKLRYFSLFTLMSVLLIYYGAPAHAAYGFNQTAEYTANATRNFTVPFVANTTISVPAGAAIGQVIYEQRNSNQKF